MKKWKYILILLVLSFLTHFIYLNYPKEVVFDEVHFGKFISGYMTGNYFFDIHPPLAKLMITEVGKIGGFHPGLSFANIGQSFPDESFLWLRLLPAFAGSLLPLIIFLLCLEFSFSEMASFCAGLLIIFENSLLVQSRFILLDSLLLAFGFGGLLFYFIARRKRNNPKVAGEELPLTQTGAALPPEARFPAGDRHPDSRLLTYEILSAICLACSLSIKWTGFSFLGLVILMEMWKHIRYWKSFWIFVKRILRTFLIFIILPLVIYILIFAIHFHLLSKSGPGDAFMTQAFQKTLIGSSYQNQTNVKSEAYPLKFAELNVEMYQANKTLTATHPYSSKWYTWPFMERPVYYWLKAAPADQAGKLGVKEAKIYLLGNPFIYWLSSLSILLLILSLILPNLREPVSRRERGSRPRKWKVPVLLLIGYLANLLPFIFIGRVMFLYHYFTALIFAIITLVYLIDQIENEKNKKMILTIISILSIFFFIWFIPFTYGIPLTDHAQKFLFWFSSWR